MYIGNIFEHVYVVLVYSLPISHAVAEQTASRGLSFPHLRNSPLPLKAKHRATLKRTGPETLYAGCYTGPIARQPWGLARRGCLQTIWRGPPVHSAPCGVASRGLAPPHASLAAHLSKMSSSASRVIYVIPVPSEGVNFCPGLFFLVFQTGVDQNRPHQDPTRQKTPFRR